MEKKKKETIITSKDDLNKIQNELVNRGDGVYVKNELPKGAKYTKLTFTRNMAICLIYVYKHYRHSMCEITDYFPKKIFTQYLKDYPNITRNFNRLKYWDCIEPMPTSPNEIKYKKGWYGITDNGIKFIQQEVGLPKCAFIYNDFAYEHQTNPYVMITDLIEDEALKELLKIN